MKAGSLCGSLGSKRSGAIKPSTRSTRSPTRGRSCRRGMPNDRFGGIEGDAVGVPVSIGKRGRCALARSFRGPGAFGAGVVADSLGAGVTAGAGVVAAGAGLVTGGVIRIGGTRLGTFGWAGVSAASVVPGEGAGIGGVVRGSGLGRLTGGVVGTRGAIEGTELVSGTVGTGLIGS